MGSFFYAIFQSNHFVMLPHYSIVIFRNAKIGFVVKLLLL